MQKDHKEDKQQKKFKTQFRSSKIITGLISNHILKSGYRSLTTLDNLDL